MVSDAAAGIAATATAGSASSYVDGPMFRMGHNSAGFTFPLGKGGQYAPLGVTAGGYGTTFKAEYIGTDPDATYPRGTKQPTVGFVNRCGYWNLDRTAGSGTTTATLGWNNNPCFASAPVDAFVTAWQSSQWKHLGNAAYTGNSTTGTVKNSAAFTTYPQVLNVGGVCGLTAGLTANRDTLYSGYLATFTATPSNQPSYKFYVNDVLKQDSSVATFKTHTLVNGDSVKVL